MVSTNNNTKKYKKKTIINVVSNQKLNKSTRNLE